MTGHAGEAPSGLSMTSRPPAVRPLVEAAIASAKAGATWRARRTDAAALAAAIAEHPVPRRAGYVEYVVIALLAALAKDTDPATPMK